MIAVAVALAALAALLVPLAHHGLFDPHPGRRCKPRPDTGPVRTLLHLTHLATVERSEVPA